MPEQRLQRTRETYQPKLLTAAQLQLMLERLWPSHRAIGESLDGELERMFKEHQRLYGS